MLLLTVQEVRRQILKAIETPMYFRGKSVTL